jgi:uncharacterized Fe-S center protein
MPPKKAQVFFTKDISSNGLLQAYQALKIKLPGKVAVKVHSGEPGGKHFVQPAMMRPLVELVQGTIVECNTAYEGKRYHSHDHLKTLKDHGFTAIAPVDLLDETADIAIPITNGKHLSENYVGAHLPNYDSLLVLSHFKGHIMGGYGGALKNIAIGLASRRGKGLIHGAGDLEKIWSAEQDDFLESMAEAASSIVTYFPQKIAYLNVMNNLSIDCDCMPHPHRPTMADIGILSSLDPIALDQACIDLIYASPDPGKKHLIERLEEKHGVHLLEAAAALNLGSRAYTLINLD